MVNRERIGKCSICGQNAAVNTPYVDLYPTGGEYKIYCYRCINDGKVPNHMFIAIEQFLDIHGHPVINADVTSCSITVEYSWNRILLYRDILNDRNVRAFTHGGRRSYPITEDETYCDVTEMLDRIQMIVGSFEKDYKDGWGYKCTRCEMVFEGKPAGFPLFSGVACPNCWKKHQEHLQEQRKNGKVCRLCHEPYDNCCC